MRGEFEVPEGKGYVLGDLFVRGKPLKYGAQLAGASQQLHHMGKDRDHITT